MLIFVEKPFFMKRIQNGKQCLEKQNFINLKMLKKKILRELFDNSRINITKISRKHDLSIDIIRNRIKKLENNQIIIKYQPIIDYNKLGYEFFKTFLYFKNLSKYDEFNLIKSFDFVIFIIALFSKVPTLNLTNCL